MVVEVERVWAIGKIGWGGGSEAGSQAGWRWVGLTSLSQKL